MRQLVHRGSVLARAYALSDTARSRRAVLRCWQPGHAVWTWGAQLVWQLPEPERIACDAAPGLPLVEQSRRLCGAPFTAKELEDAPAGIAAVERGALVVRPVGAAVDPSQWLDLSTFKLAGPVQPLGDPPPPVEAVFVPRPVTDARTALGMQALGGEAAAVAESLRTGQPAGERPPINIGPVARSLVSAARRLTGWLSRLLPGRAAPAAQGSAASTALAPLQRGWLDRFDAWLQRVLDASRLSSVLGRRQADYFARLMQMFERGDLDAALRHAVPLAGEGASGRPRPSRGLPSPRDSLDISLGGRGAASTSFVLVDDYYEELRARYRAAAEKLEREGRYRDAAFVLAELLNAENEAVALLERHGELKLAAELAEARGLPAGLQVRQWFLAKDVTRAVAVARRHGVFGDAIGRLERTKHEAEAKQLRLLWADSQANSGDFYNAVVTLWDHEDARPLTRRWLELGIAQGGAPAVRLEVRRLVLDGAKADPKPVMKLLESDDADDLLSRSTLVHELQEQRRVLDSSVAKLLARAAVRTVVRDAFGAPPPELLELAADGALRADLPADRAPDVRLSSRTPPVRIDIDGYDKGALPVHDAALLPDGRMLLALGEAGARLVTRDGRTAAHFDVPAESLVPYDAGGFSLCLSRRGEVFIASRLNLLERTVERLPQLQLFSFCDGTDGSMWFVHTGEALCGFDLHDPKLRVLWRVPMPAMLGRPQRSALSLSAVPSSAPGELEWWRYELPSLTLRARLQLHLPPVNERVHVLADGNTCVTQGGIAWQQQFSGANRRQLTGLAGGVIIDADGAGDWLSLVARSEAGNRWMLSDLGGATVRFVVQLPRSTFNVRMRPEVAVYSDGEGRVLAVNLHTGRLMRDLRVR